MKRKFVDELHWIDEQEMLDLVALAQSSPGAIAVNAAILVGWRVCGFAGMLTAVLGTILPPMIILSVISLFYAAFCQQRICGFGVKRNAGRSCRCDPGCDMQSGRQCAEGKKCIQHYHHGSSFLPLHSFFNVNVIYIILTAGLLGAGKAVWIYRKGKSA